MTNKLLLLILTVSICACGETKKEQIAHLVEKYKDKTLLYPTKEAFVRVSGDSVQKCNMEWNEFSIITYIDSIGCTSCKLHLKEWEKLTSTINEETGKTVNCLFVFHPRNKKELIHILKREHFYNPIYIDENYIFYKLNKLSSNAMFQTFLVNKENKVIAIGNPINNRNIKSLYLNIISGNKTTKEYLTEAKTNTNVCFLGNIPIKETKKYSFTIQNTGKNMLIIKDITTSCGCTSVEYSKKPVISGEKITITVIYKADYQGSFDKEINIHCNTISSPLLVKIKGHALLN